MVASPLAFGPVNRHCTDTAHLTRVSDIAHFPKSPRLIVHIQGLMHVDSINTDILLIDDEPRHAKALEQALTARGGGPSNLAWVRTLSSGLEALAHKEVGAIFLNLYLPDIRGLDTLDRLLSAIPALPIVVIAGVADEDICKTA